MHPEGAPETQRAASGVVREWEGKPTLGSSTGSSPVTTLGYDTRKCALAYENGVSVLVPCRRGSCVKSDVPVNLADLG